MSYYSQSIKTTSEKIVLVTCEAVERLKIFSASGLNWSRVVSNFVVGVKENGVAITSWSFNPLTKTLLIIGGTNPSTRNISVTYRFFLSSAPVNIPYDLASGEEVEFEPYINSIGAIGQQLDEESTGIVLESSSTLDLINTDGRFDDIFDSLIWENQAIKFYSWFPNIPITEKVQIFDGVITSKSFTGTNVSFKVSDFVYKLKNNLNLGTFSALDGRIVDSQVGKQKRRIYGKADQVKCVSLDAILGGYNITGTASAALSSNTLTGVGTLFLSELSPQDELQFTVNSVLQKIAVESIESDTSLTLGKIIDFAIVSSVIRIKPYKTNRNKNRTWMLAGHKLRNPITTITSVISNNRFLVASTLDMFAGDEIIVNGSQTTIRRIVGSEIVTNSAISPTPSVSDTIEKGAVSAAYYGIKEMVLSRDYTLTNVIDAQIIIDPLAEFNITEQIGLSNSLIFTSGTRSITTVDVVDLRTVLSSGDWIRSSNIGEPDWYEILQVLEQEIILRTNFTGASGTKTSYYKNIIYIGEESLITADCMGMERSGLWIKTASDAVRDIVLNDAEFASVNEASFIKANSECDYILSLVIPENVNSDAVVIRDTITQINESVFGSLYGNLTNNISYSIFNSTKPETLEALKDDDIISFSVQSNQRIINKAIISYKPFVDLVTGENAFAVGEHTSSFVNSLIGIKNTEELISYIYEEGDAKIIAQRICFFRSLSNSTISLKAKMNFASAQINDKVYLSLDRLFRRYGGSEKKRIGVITGIKNNGYGVDLSISDMGNIYNRVMSIAPNSTVDYLSSSGDDKIRWGYVLDNNMETADTSSEDGLGSNLIG